MSHIHKLIDFTVGAFIVFKSKVLLVNHKELKLWLPPGGHIELDEDPEQALIREIEEETGLKKSQIDIMSEKPRIRNDSSRKMLLPPKWLDIHWINKTHKHIGLGYVVKSKTQKVVLAKKEHYEIRWFTERDLNNNKYKLISNIKFYCKEAVKICKI